MGSEQGWAERAADNDTQVLIVVVGPRDAVPERLKREFDRAIWRDEAGCRSAGDAEPDLIFLSVGHPEDLSAIARLRETWPVPVVAAVRAGAELATGAEVGELSCLAAGADGYVGSGDDPRVTAMRLRALVRRHRAGTAGDGATRNLLRRGPLKIDLERREVQWRNQPVSMSETEMRLLVALAMRPGFVKSRGQLMDVVGENRLDVTDRTIDSHIKRLRQKLRRMDPQFSAIRTLYGVGYSFAPPPE
ncbi:MAG: winged helix-turn-helix domain-containing protein [Qingshengfaniella sp.]